MLPSRSLETEHPINFRAPPPSPVNSGRRYFFSGDEVLSEFLDSTQVPELILPDTVFPRPRSIESVPIIDLISDLDEIPAIAAEIGCFQVANHGISPELVRAATEAAGAGLFSVPVEKRSVVTRSPEMPYGFEESEEFVWSVHEGLNAVMEGIWPLGYSNFCKEMETLLSKVEKVGEKMSSMMTKKHPRESIPNKSGNKTQSQTVCCVYKNTKTSDFEKDDDDARHDVIRMLIRRNEHSHAFCFHFCADSAQFHVYSKKEWLSFCPRKDSVLVTIGDQIQTWSGGQYKHVTGRPIFKEDSVSMAFLYSSLTTNKATSKSMPNIISSEKTISFNKQVVFAIFLTLLYQIWTCI